MLAFQDAYGLRADGECDEVTWSMLVEASWSLGDRLLYLRSPNLRGDDVAELQTLLSRLGFDCGRVDGIYGPLTVRAVTEFQQNCGLAGDGICGPTLVDTLGRIGGHSGTGPGIAAVRETEALGPDSNLHRIAVGQYGSTSNIAHSVSRRLKAAFPQTITVEGEPVDQALTANRFGADVYVGIEPSPMPVALFATTRFRPFQCRWEVARAAPLEHLVEKDAGHAEPNSGSADADPA